MALSFGEPGELEQALDLTDKVLRGMPSHYTALQGRIEVLAMLGHLPEAQEAARSSCHFIRKPASQVGDADGRTVRPWWKEWCSYIGLSAFPNDHPPSRRDPMRRWPRAAALTGSPRQA
jgi:hypothetical protein